MKTLNLHSKIIIFIIILVTSLVSIALLGLQAMRHASEIDNNARINQLIKSTTNIVKQFELLANSNKLTEIQAKEYAAQLLRENKYHESEYVYVVDENLNFVATPHDPQLHNTSFNDFKDASGASIGKMVKRLVGNKTEKIITYNWDSERNGEVISLTSVVQKTKYWGWYIGTGISGKEADERYWSTAKWLLTSAMIISIIISLVLAKFGFGLSTNLGAEINDVLNVVRQVSRGNLQLDSKYKDATEHSIIGAMNYMQQNLLGLVGNIQAVSQSLSKQGNSSAESASDLEQLTEGMSSETKSVANTIAQLTTSVNFVSDLTQQAGLSITKAEKQGKNAFSLTEESTKTITLLEKQIESAGNNIQVLDDEVTNIATVLTVIQGIAEQTNLLALNAAIEAARAGDQGRGFAVVADEVRQLAQRTQTSTEEIQITITTLQNATKDARHSVTQSMNTSEKTVIKAQKVSTELEEISQTLSDISQMSQQISSATKEQLSAGEEAIKSIALISDIASNTEKVSHQSHQLSGQIKLHITDLESEMNKFHL
jgi:methyl-accepting chemotaxis protein